MLYAKIKNNLIVNTVTVRDESLIASFSQDTDSCVRIDNLTPIPGLGWSYDGTNFTPPSTPNPTLIATLESMPIADRMMSDLRSKRNSLLAACDWTQLSDSSLATEAKAQWAEYRQALRNLPDNPDLDLYNVTWPTPPSK